MPYDDRSDLPESVRNSLPAHAEEIYQAAFNSAYNQYKDLDDRKQGGSREEVAHRVAWAAVKQKYEKDEEGTWHAKSS